jgi:hypothetical protein
MYHILGMKLKSSHKNLIKGDILRGKNHLFVAEAEEGIKLIQIKDR